MYNVNILTSWKLKMKVFWCLVYVVALRLFSALSLHIPLKVNNKLFSRYMHLKFPVFILQKNDPKVRMTNGYSEMKHQPQQHFTLLEALRKICHR